MFRRFLRTISILLSVASFAFAIGCASRINLVEDGMYSIYTQDIKDIKITTMEISVNDGKFMVTGKLKRAITSRSYPGHVDVSIIGPDGSVLDQISVKNKMPFIGRSKRKNSSFRAEFSQIPPEGATVKISFHGKTSSEGEEFDCGANVAKDDDGSY